MLYNFVNYYCYHRRQQKNYLKLFMVYFKKKFGSNSLGIILMLIFIFLIEQNKNVCPVYIWKSSEATSDQKEKTKNRNIYIILLDYRQSYSRIMVQFFFVFLILQQTYLGNNTKSRSKYSKTHFFGKIRFFNLNPFNYDTIIPTLILSFYSGRVCRLTFGFQKRSFLRS